MTWFKVDDGLAFHAKVVQAGNAAMGLWVRAGSWCAQQLTDGFVPDHIVTTLGTKGQAKILADVGLWSREDGGYRFHGWLDYQPTRESVEKERAEARDRMKRAREARKAQPRSADVRANTQRTSGDVRSTRPDPTRPDPSRPLVGKNETSRGSVESVIARDPNEPPRCPQHKTLNRREVPNCWACQGLREDWEQQRGADTVFHRAPWCGECNPSNRLREMPDGTPYRCPECHPLAEVG